MTTLGKHPSVGYAVRLGGHRVHAAIVFDKDTGLPRGLDAAVHKTGASFRESMKLIVELASSLLQHGVSVETVAALLAKAPVGGPGGVVTDCDGVTEATSVPDFLSQILRKPRQP